MKICVVAGARPNFIKVAPLLRAVENARKQGTDIEARLVYTGAEDDATLEDSLFDALDINKPDFFLGVTCPNLNELTGQVMSKFEDYLSHRPADCVVVVDDLASTMAVAIVTKKQGIKLAHIAAGTRSFDITMPKEINRLVIDGLSDLLFTAGQSNNSIANREGAELSKVYMVGNILMDNIRHLQPQMEHHKPAIMEQLRLAEDNYMVFTLNRKVLIAKEEQMLKMVETMLEAAQNVPIVAPLRKDAREMMESCLMKIGNKAMGIHLVEPLDYLSFSYLAAHAKGVITDSGNVAEEATFHQVPCITLNSYTEHIETVKVGTNVLVGEDAQKLFDATADIVAGRWKKAALPDRWDGRTAARMVQILLEQQG